MELTSAQRARLKARATDVQAKLSLGRSGMSDAFVDELRAHLKKDQLVKVKLLEAAREKEDRRALGEQLADAVGAALIEVRGNTAVLWKPRAGQGEP